MKRNVEFAREGARLFSRRLGNEQPVVFDDEGMPAMLVRDLSIEVSELLAKDKFGASAWSDPSRRLERSHRRGRR